MERRYEKVLEEWYFGTGRKPLVIRGARQVGKSTLVRRVARKLDIPLWEINLERYSTLDGVFAEYNIKKIITELGIVSGISGIGESRGILFLDEIQAAPHALAALRYFFEDRPDIAVVAAGSLLEFVLADYPYSMPVGRVEYLWIGPVVFSEYLHCAAPKPVVDGYLNWNPGEGLSPALHTELLEFFRQFILCGGMPEAAALFAENRDAVRLHSIHRSILDTYRDDFGKYSSKGSVVEIRKVFDYLPSGIGKKLRWSTVSPDSRAAGVKKAFNLLVQAGIALPVIHSSGTGIPLSAAADESCMKPLFLDVGLMQSALGTSLLTIEEFSEIRFINEGAVAEQVVGQELYFSDDRGARPLLHYWLRESKSTNAEVDYLVAAHGAVIPIEVKAGSAGALRSLHQFMATHQSPFAVRFDLNPPAQLTVDTVIMTADGKKPVSYKLITLPLYFAGRISGIAKKYV